MRKEYDISKLKRAEPKYLRHIKESVTMRLDPHVVSYFKALASETGIPYQNLINLYLRDCVASQRKLSVQWISKN